MALKYSRRLNVASVSYFKRYVYNRLATQIQTHPSDEPPRAKIAPLWISLLLSRAWAKLRSPPLDIPVIFSPAVCYYCATGDEAISRFDGSASQLKNIAAFYLGQDTMRGPTLSPVALLCSTCAASHKGNVPDFQQLWGNVREKKTYSS